MHTSNNANISFVLRSAQTFTSGTGGQICWQNCPGSAAMDHNINNSKHCADENWSHGHWVKYDGCESQFGKAQTRGLSFWRQQAVYFPSIFFMPRTIFRLNHDRYCTQDPTNSLRYESQIQKKEYFPRHIICSFTETVILGPWVGEMLLCRCHTTMHRHQSQKSGPSQLQPLQVLSCPHVSKTPGWTPGTSLEGYAFQGDW